MSKQAFVAWIRALEDDVIQGEFGYEPGEFNVHPENWRPLYDKGLTPKQAFERALAAHEEARKEGEELKRQNWERIKAADAAALARASSPAPQQQGVVEAAPENDTPVRCPECNWCGRADELGPEGECGRGPDCSGLPGEITEPADLIQAWQDTEGQVGGARLADAGLIAPAPGSEAAAQEEWGADALWDLTPDGRAALRAARGGEPS
ncbi:hypothetical protein ACIU1J_27470 [Azospirillum doebereinerae]|uniref:hypothetical protein n=1 Tax=Azospirillum doebereinerae TaxID=92933 RepID=UPI001EE5BF2C|nr:hypothetical protein [Azospirillum doebereinerae]MCG5241359.1 hypothetical protein [Azospirillum doebereinerae]